MHFQPPVKSTNCRFFLYLILPFCLLIANHHLSAQYFKPFHANSKAMFTTWPEKGTTSSLSFIDAVEEGTDSIFTTFKIINTQDWENMILPDTSCEGGFWGTGGMCFPLNTPLWLGQDIRKSSEMDYRYVNTYGDTLHFDFSVTDSSLIYQDGVQLFYLIYEVSDTATWLNHADSVARYRIAHLDANGIAINSTLHDAPVVIGKDLGMIQFLRIDSFPQVLQPIQLAGHVGEEAGIWSLMSRDIHDFNPGDFFQYKYEQSALAEDYPGYTEYRNISVLSRTETADSIFYTRSIETYRLDHNYEIIEGIYVYMPDTTYTLDTTQFTVSKTNELARIPLEAQIYTGYSFRKLHLNNGDCGPEWKFTNSGSRLDYCSADSIGCYGDHSNLAPGDLIQIQGFSTIGKGVGLINSYGGWEQFGGIQNSQSNTLIYHEKNGLPCGLPWVLSSTRPEVLKNRLKIYPNPAQTSFQVEIPDMNDEITQIEIFSLQGRSVLHQKGINPGQNVSIESLPSGIYVVKASTQKRAYTQKLIVNR